MGAKGLGVDGGEVDSAAVLLGHGAEQITELLPLLRCLGKDVGERDTGRHIARVGVGAYLANERGGGRLGEELNCFFVKLFTFVDRPTFVELLVQHDGWRLHLLSLSDGRVVAAAE